MDSGYCYIHGEAGRLSKLAEIDSAAVSSKDCKGRSVHELAKVEEECSSC